MNDDPRVRDIETGAETKARVLEALDATVRVVLAEGADRWARQLSAICLVDLLGRLLPRIEVVCDSGLEAHPNLPPGTPTLVERLEEPRRSSLIEPQEIDGEPRLTVVIGTGAEGDVHLDGAGWISYLGDAPGGELAEDDVNPIGALVAACRGAGAVIRLLLADLYDSALLAPSYWSALTLAPCEAGDASSWPALPGPRIDALLMGAGSIGGASAYVFARVPELSGSLPILDFDALEAKNSRKALLARREEIEARAAKAVVAAAELEHLSDLAAEPFQTTLAAYVAARPAGEPLPLVLCAVDSIPARRELADHMALEVVNAACSDTGIVVSGHRTGEGPCVYCLYIDQVLDAEATRAAMMAREFGLPEQMIVQLRINPVGLELQHLRHIERTRRLPPGALSNFRGRTLDQLFDEHALYGEIRIPDEEGRRATLQLPFVPALAGVLLASEALKHGSGKGFAPYRLGPGGLAIEYSESLLQAPVGMLSDPLRPPGSACLCASPRRLALMRERYGIPKI